MLDVKKLPKSPMEALKVALQHGVAATKGATSNYHELKKNNHPIASDLMITFAVIKRCAVVAADADLKEMILLCTKTNDKTSLAEVRFRLESAFNAVIAHDLDEHFFDEEDVEAFDYAQLDEEEKNEIKALMRDARVCVDNANGLLEWQRRNILHHIAKIENELLKTKSRFGSFLAAGYETSALVKKVGEDAQPIASAIQKALTITYRKVEGQKQIEKEAEPKKLPKPDE